MQCRSLVFKFHIFAIIVEILNFLLIVFEYGDEFTSFTTGRQGRLKKKNKKSWRLLYIFIYLSCTFIKLIVFCLYIIRQRQ